ncbi:MAG TPA: hypothetical protein VIG74_03030 [Alphaproteobacteria bacterium]|jgi:hypothetical protein
MSDHDKCAHEFHEVCKDHKGHDHGENCGHPMIDFGSDEINYLHDGELHHPHKDKDHTHKIALPVSDEHPVGCTKTQFQAAACDAHDNGEICGPKCGHEAVWHGNGPDRHLDYLVPFGDTGLVDVHCPDKDHCDDHGWVVADPNGAPAP